MHVILITNQEQHDTSQTPYFTTYNVHLYVVCM